MQIGDISTNPKYANDPNFIKCNGQIIDSKENINAIDNLKFIINEFPFRENLEELSSNGDDLYEAIVCKTDSLYIVSYRYLYNSEFFYSLITSQDGKSWTGRGAINASKIIFGNNMICIFTSAGYFYKSIDGINYIKKVPTYNFNAIFFMNNINLFYGTVGNIIYSSTDLEIWTLVESTINGSTIRNILLENNLFVIRLPDKIAYGQSLKNLAYYTVECIEIAYGNSNFAYVNSFGGVYLSKNCDKWTSLGEAKTYEKPFTIVFVKDCFVVMSNNATGHGYSAGCFSFSKRIINKTSDIAEFDSNNVWSEFGSMYYKKSANNIFYDEVEDKFIFADNKLNFFKADIFFKGTLFKYLNEAYIKVE